MKISKEFQVGLLTVISGAVLYFGFNYLKGINAFSSSHHYYAVYEQVDGLQVSNPVMINGLTVGRVNDISIMEGGSNKILVDIEVEDGISVKQNSEAHLVDNGLLGGKMISLILKRGAELQDGDTLTAKKPLGMMDELQSSASPLMAKVGTMMDSTTALINAMPMTMKKVDNLMDQFSATAASYKTTADNLNAIMNQNKDKIDGILSNFEKISASMTKIDGILDKMNTVADSLSQAEFAAVSSELRQTLAEAKTAMKAMNEGEGTMGQIMTNKEMYENMNTTIKDLDKLFIDMKENPGRYVQVSVFGKKDKAEKEKKKKEKAEAKQKKAEEKGK